MATTTSPLLERGDELTTIERILDAAIAGDGGLLMVEGEAGAGKTSLLGACARLGAVRGMRVLRARGGEYERDFPYGVVRQLFEPPLAEQADRAEPLSGTAAMAAPVFSGEAGASGGGEPFAVQHGLYWLLADLAEASPLLLAVDDAQWADLASLQALAYIARRLEGLPVSLVLGVRVGEPGAHQALLDELRREPGVELLTPKPLAETAVSELAARELGAGPSQLFAAACCRASAGNPFLVVELLRALAADGIAPSDPNADRLEEIAAAGVSRSILLRLGRLGDAGVDSARAIAILEPNAELEHVAALTGMSAEEAAAACSRLIEARLLDDSRPLGFVHPLIRSAVYADIAEPRRAVLHAAAAKRLAAAGGSLDSVAAHLLLAAPAGERSVVETLRRAAGEASDRGAPEPAVGYLRRALAEPPLEAERPAVERELGSALVRASDSAGVEALLALRESSEDAVARAEIVAELAISLTYRGRGEETVALLEQSLAELDGSDPKLELRLRGELLELSLWDREGIPGWLLDGIEELAGTPSRRAGCWSRRPSWRRSGWAASSGPRILPGPRPPISTACEPT
jgi:predicted ATPase